jgi:predicted glycogen debranching enzyme
VYAIWKYWQYTGNDKVVKEWLPALREVIDCYREGTDFGIKMTENGLITCGGPGLQVTWMDAKVGDWVVTPRTGMPVEINALWYNAVRSLADISEKLGDRPAALKHRALARQTAKSFQQRFWYEQGGYLYDVVGEEPDAALRPNQLLAVSLPFPVLSGERAVSVVKVCERRLLTPYGLRTLAPGSPGYCGRYFGDQRARDGAYHQGTVWAWLMGPFISAYVRVHRGTPKAKQRARRLLQPLLDHVDEAGLGSISEIFEGDAPHWPCGCISQAWSVGEVLRAFHEDVIGWKHSERKPRRARSQKREVKR